MNENRGSGSGRRAALVVVGLALLALLVGSCRSLSKQELEQRLRAIDKNKAVGELSRLRFQADLGDGPQEFDLVHYTVKAREPGATLPVVLVHGTPSTLFSWSELIHGDGATFAGLAAERDVVAIEVVGHGIAPGSAAPYDFEHCARFVSAAVRALDLGPVHLIGSSYGGEFAWRAALNEPELFASLVLLDSSGVERRDADWLSEEVLMRENGLAKLGWRLNSEERIEGALAPHFRELPPGRVEEFFLVCSNAHNWKAMVDLARDENGEREAELSNLAVPTLAVWGSDDLAYPVEHYGERFVAEIPDARLHVLAETGHYPHEERPAELLRAVVPFLASREPAP